MKNKLTFVEDYAVMSITRRNGDVFEIKIDKESIEKLEKHKYSWHVGWNKKKGRWYATSAVYKGMKDGKAKYETVHMHRYLTNANRGDYVDHRNHDSLDNRLENLKITTNQKNSINRKGVNSNTSTGVRNVSYDRRNNKYIVQLQIDGKNTCFGRFDNLDDAAKCAEINRNKYYKL